MKKEFKLGDIVYLVTDSDQSERIVTGVLETYQGYEYRLSLGSDTSWHTGIEISIERDVLKTTTN